MEKHYRKENNCLNCGATLQGKYCHVCGQENLEIKESFGHMMNHAISDYFHFDHQFFHTLKPLFLKPGKLTNEYMAGRRAQFLHPVKMYIFISVVFFLLVFSDSNKETKTETKEKAKTETNAKPVSGKLVRDSIRRAIEKNKDLSSTQKKKIEKQIDNYGVIKVTENYDDDSSNNKKKRDDILKFTATDDTTLAQYHASQLKLAEADRDGFIERRWTEKALVYHEKYGKLSKEILWEEIKHNIPKMMFLLLPLFALILRVTFWKNRKYYVEHLIYSFHLHCFLFLFIAILMLLHMVIPIPKAINDIIDLGAYIYVIWYIYKSLRVVYHRSRFRTITKMIGMSFMYFFACSLCLSLIVLMTAIGFELPGH